MIRLPRRHPVTPLIFIRSINLISVDLLPRDLTRDINCDRCSLSKTSAILPCGSTTQESGSYGLVVEPRNSLDAQTSREITDELAFGGLVGRSGGVHEHSRVGLFPTALRTSLVRKRLTMSESWLDVLPQSKKTPKGKIVWQKKARSVGLNKLAQSWTAEPPVCSGQRCFRVYAALCSDGRTSWRKIARNFCSIFFFKANGSSVAKSCSKRAIWAGSALGQALRRAKGVAGWS
jgi:hypothetical protein